MNLFNPMRLLQFEKKIITPIQYVMQVNGYAVPGGALAKGKKAAKKGAVMEKKELEVETDVSKLLTYCCGSNYFIEGEDVKLKPDSEYPDWLWNLRTGPKLPIEELDPNTKQYWRRRRQEAVSRFNRLKKRVKMY